MIVLIDNYDSFTYNLAQYLMELGCQLRVFRNDAVTVAYIETLNPKAIVISPGPGRPESAGITLDAIKYFSGRVPILGVCLGHQAIAHAFGGKVIRAKQIMHGKTSKVISNGASIFDGLKRPFVAMRYHSLVVDKNTLPDCLDITAESDDGEIMGIKHKKHPTEGIQFHPESIGTPVGKRILRNFVSMISN